MEKMGSLCLTLEFCSGNTKICSVCMRVCLCVCVVIFELNITVNCVKILSVA